MCGKLRENAVFFPTRPQRRNGMNKQLSNRAAIEKAVTKALRDQPIVDMHTHLYTPEFGTPNTNRTGKTDPNGLLLWGLDELLTYHYLVAEVFRIVPATELPY